MGHLQAPEAQGLGAQGLGAQGLGAQVLEAQVLEVQVLEARALVSEAQVLALEVAVLEMALFRAQVQAAEWGLALVEEGDLLLAAEHGQVPAPRRDLAPVVEPVFRARGQAPDMELEAVAQAMVGLVRVWAQPLELEQLVAVVEAAAVVVAWGMEEALVLAVAQDSHQVRGQVRG